MLSGVWKGIAVVMLVVGERIMQSQEWGFDFWNIRFLSFFVSL